MRLTFLGTGAAGGVPLWGCACTACTRATRIKAYRRAPCCALVEVDDERILIDAGLPVLAERFPAGDLSRILLTHYHPDHVQGLFHLRWGVGGGLPVHGPPDSEGCADLYKNPGVLTFERLAEFAPLQLPGVRITPVPLIHSKPTLGFCIEAGDARLAYLTDTAGLPPATLAFLVDFAPTVVVLDCNHPPQHEPPRNHNDLNMALALSDSVGSRRTFLTHLSHELDAWLMAHGERLPEDIAVARDGEVVVI